QKIEWAAKTAARGKFVNAAAQHENAIAHLIGERGAEFGNMLIEFAARLHDELGRGRRSRSAHVRDKIGDGEIGFVADTGNDGDFRIEDGAGDDFFVEGPEIFHGTAAAREDQDIRELSLIEKPERPDDFFGGAFALHANWKNG